MTAPTRHLSGRVRLALWYAAVLAATLLTLGGAGFWLIQRELYAAADDVLRAKAAAVQTEIDVTKGRLSFHPPKLPDTQLPAVALGLDVVRIWDRNSRPVYTQEGIPGLQPADPVLVRAILADQQSLVTTRAEGGAPVRLYREPVRENQRIIGAVEVGRSLGEIEATLDRLRFLGAVGSLAALALASVGGYFLAGRALAPVDRITRAAERIGADDLSRRLALPPVDDELGRLARAFDGMIDRLDRAFQRQRQFTADAAHELRTPLAIIRSQVDAARRRPREPIRDRSVLDDVYDESARLGRLVERLLTLARIDEGQPLALAPLDLEELVADVSERVGPRAHERGIRLDVCIGEAPSVHGDATWVAQLLQNLIDNALRHTAAGGRVTLSLEPAPDGAVLRVADTGEGIAAEHLPYIFERFYRADPARTRTSGGAGLGLAICAWVARAHDGRLTVESEPARGSIFTLWLPRARAVHDARRSRTGTLDGVR